MELFGGLLIGLACGAVSAWFIAKSKFQPQKKEGLSKQEIDEVIRLNRELAEVEAHNKAITEKLSNQKEEVEQLQNQFSKEFENLANKILEEKTKKFTEQNHTNLKQVLGPLGEKIKDFEQKVEQKYLNEEKGRSALSQQIKGLAELNLKMSEEASNLAKALKGDSKTQGDWGEMRLELILEKAGLMKDVHFTTQETFRDEDGALKKPDFIIKLPEDKSLIIDSKVSLTAYEAYFNTEDKNQRAISLKEHLNSVRDHIKELSGKNYHNLYQINSPDYVLMYLPIEPAFMLAVQTDQSLYTEALDRNVVMVTTSTLLATMSTVSSIWQQEDQKKNVLEIARQSGALYDKFVGFTDDMIKVGQQMDTSKKTYEAAMNKLSSGTGNLVKRADDIRKLGAKTSKNLSPSILERSEQSQQLEQGD